MTKRSERIGSPAAKAVTAAQAPVSDTSGTLLPDVPAPSTVPAAKAVTAAGDDKIQMFLHRDCWDEKGVRHKKGTVVPFSVDTAKALKKSGKAERYDPIFMGDA